MVITRLWGFLQTNKLASHEIIIIISTYNLRRRRIIVLDWCSMCKKNDKSIDHLFLQYEEARNMWDDFFVRILDCIGSCLLDGWISLEVGEISEATH